MTLKSNAKFEGKLICRFKNDKNLVNFDLSKRNSQSSHIDWLLLCKVYNVWHKKLQTISFITRKRDAKFEEKRTSGLKNDIRSMANFHQSIWKSQNWDFDGIPLFFKFTEELCVMKKKNDAKFEEELTCRFKFDTRNLLNFDRSTQKSQKFAL